MLLSFVRPAYLRTQEEEEEEQEKEEWEEEEKKEHTADTYVESCHYSSYCCVMMAL